MFTSHLKHKNVSVQFITRDPLPFTLYHYPLPLPFTRYPLPVTLTLYPLPFTRYPYPLPVTRYPYPYPLPLPATRVLATPKEDVSGLSTISG